MKKKLYIVISLSLLYGCNSREGNKQEKMVESFNPVTIDVTKIIESDKPLMLSQFAETISYISLSEEPLIGDISYTSVVVIDDTIYVDSENIYKYTSKGKFIKKLFVVGQGPGEALKSSTTPAAFNKKEKYVTFSYKSIFNVSYSFNGDFLGKSDPVEEDSHKFLETYFNDYSLYSTKHRITSDSRNSLGQYLFYVKDINTDSVFYFYPNPAANDNPSFNAQIELDKPDMNFIHIDSVLWFKHYVLDTIYSTQDFINILPRYIFKTDNTYLNIHEYIQFRNKVLDLNRVKVAKTITGILPLPTGDLLFTINGKLSLASKDGNVYSYTLKSSINDIDEYLKEIDIANIIESRTFYVENNYLYILVDAFKFFEDGCKPPFNELMEESNPVVVKIKLKTPSQQS